MKAVNLTLYSKDPTQLQNWYEQYVFLGRNVRKYRDRVVVFAYPRKEKKDDPKRGREKKTDENAPKTPAHAEQRSKRERWYE